MSVFKNKWFILGNILLLLIVIPVTLFVVRQQTDLRSKAAPTTTLSFTPATATTGVGETASFDIFVDPGQNVVSVLEITVKVDPNILEIVSLERDETVFPISLPTNEATEDTISLAVSTSNDISQAVQERKKAATLVVRGKAATTAPSIISIEIPPSQAFSLKTADGDTENVLSDATTASITVTGDGTALSPTPTGTAPIGSPTSAPIQNQKPVCSSLTLDRAATGTAPYAIIFTATGTDTTGNVSKVAFNFGDGPVQEVTSGGGIGTGTVSVQIAHTFATPGTYNVTATLTDSNGLISDVGSCTQSVTIAQGSSSGGAGGTETGGGGAPAPTLPVTGTLETALMVGGGAVVAIIVGVFLFML